MEGMPRPRPPHLLREVTRHGKAVWYVRINGKRTRLRTEYGSPEFEAEYHAAIAGAPRREKGPLEGTLAWLVARYRETTTWQGLSLATRRQRENIFRHVLKSASKQPFARITAATIEAGRDRRSSTPSQARHFLDTMRGLFRWAVKAKLIKTDPTFGVDDPAWLRLTALLLGPRTTSPLMSDAGRSVRGNGSGSTCCSIPAFAAVMPCGSVASISVMASAPSRPKRPIPR